MLLPFPVMDNNSSVQAINIAEGVEKREPSYTVGENVNLHNHCDEQYGSSLKNEK